jgi:tetratricopeptide (TPR) repeat protein
MSDTGPSPIDPAKRRILQQQFEAGSKALASGQFDYAIDMFGMCVTGDPGNPIYTQNLIGALQRKFGPSKKGSSFASIRGATTKAAIVKCNKQKDWEGVIKHGIEMLKLNPWDNLALTSMAAACDELDHGTCQLAYLKLALDADIKDLEINRQLARALDKEGEYQAAIICWQRVLQARPNDEEARKGVSDAQVRNTMKKGKYEEAQSSTEVMADKVAQEERLGPAGLKRSPEQELLRAIAKSPAELANYVELADLYQREDKLEKCEEMLIKAIDVSGGDVNLKERLEDIRLRRLRNNAAIAEKQFREKPTEEHKQLYKRFLVELNNMETEVYRSRCERYPTNLTFKYELALRLHKAGKSMDAIPLLQEARADPQRKGEVLLVLGECFQQIKQFKLAMSNYVEAIEHMPERVPEGKKKALYRAGRLAMELQDFDASEKYLTDLASLDFTYKDVPALLERLRQLRQQHDGQQP